MEEKLGTTLESQQRRKEKCEVSITCFELLNNSEFSSFFIKLYNFFKWFINLVNKSSWTRNNVFERVSASLYKRNVFWEWKSDN